MSKFDAIKSAAARQPHATRARYVSGCRCMLCRAANSRYESDRARARRDGDTRNVVSADSAQKHLRSLSRAGLGYKQVADIAQVSTTIVASILFGQRRRIRAHTERAILSVRKTHEVMPDGAKIAAGPTWRLLNELLDGGYTRTWLARQLGSTAKVPALQVGRDLITVRTAGRVQRLYDAIQEGRVRR